MKVQIFSETGMEIREGGEVFVFGRSRVVIDVAQGGLCTFGAGLPDDEVTYLFSLVRQALAGKL